MRFAMDLHGWLQQSVPSQGKRFCRRSHSPSIYDMNAVFSLDGDITGVRLGHFFGSDSSLNLVNVHVRWQ